MPPPPNEIPHYLATCTHFLNLLFMSGIDPRTPQFVVLHEDHCVIKAHMHFEMFESYLKGDGQFNLPFFPLSIIPLSTLATVHKVGHLLQYNMHGGLLCYFELDILPCMLQ